MTGVIVFVSWMILGHAPATIGVSPDHRHLAWRIIGTLFGPLWLFVRADQTCRPAHTESARSELATESLAA